MSTFCKLLILDTPEDEVKVLWWYPTDMIIIIQQKSDALNGMHNFYYELHNNKNCMYLMAVIIIISTECSTFW